MLDGHEIAAVWTAVSQSRTAEALQKIDSIAQRIIGHKFISIMSFDPARHELRRVYSQHPEHYPVGARKSLQGVSWYAPVLKRLEILHVPDSRALMSVFEDHELLNSLGLGSSVNSPIISGSRCIGTLNLFHEDGWYEAPDFDAVRSVSYQSGPALSQLSIGADTLSGFFLQF